MKQRLLALFSLAFFAACCQVGSAQVVQGRINEVLDEFGTRVGSSIDYWYFTVNSESEVSIDTLSWEVDSEDRLDGDDDFAETFDVNGDGVIAFIDPYIYLFADDGDLSLDDYLDENDDSTETYSDGSIYDYDSYLADTLPAGDYVLAIGAYDLDEEEVVAGLNDETFYPATSDGLEEFVFIEIPSAPYQITWAGDLTITSGPFIPEPGSAMLLSAGIVCCWGRRR